MEASSFGIHSQVGIQFRIFLSNKKIFFWGAFHPDRVKQTTCLFVLNIYANSYLNE
jgi:hypothetical protein